MPAPSCIDSVSEVFEVIHVVEQGAGSSGQDPLIILGEPREGSLSEGIHRLYSKLVERGCYPYLRRTRLGLTLYIRRVGNAGQRILFALGLAAATFISVYISGLGLAPENAEGPWYAWNPLAYLIGLLGPLLVHEAGHWLLMRRYRVPSSIPFLIPAPPYQLGFLGTFGAVINLRWLPPSSRALALIAIAGPLAGFLVAIPLALIGLSNSLVIEGAEAARENLAPLQLVPLIMIPLSSVIQAGPDSVIVLSPLAFSAYIVFFVTFLNLIPIAMLDGGHLVRSIGGDSMHRMVSVAFIALLLLSSILAPALGIFAILALGLYLLTGGRHPGPSMALETPDSATVISIIIYGILLVLTMPVPL